MLTEALKEVNKKIKGTPVYDNLTETTLFYLSHLDNKNPEKLVKGDSGLEPDSDFNIEQKEDTKDK